MAVDTNKPEEQTQPTEQTTEVVSPYAMHLQQLGSIGAEQEALQAKYDTRQAELSEMQKRINDAKANQMSVLSAFVQQQKPQYDEKKEKRMRNRAMIQAFGDVLSEASKGYFAYNKKGAGVVPKSTPSNALDEVNKISEMQKKYLNDKKAWDNLNLEWQQKKTQADIDAAEALLAKEEKYQAKIEQRLEELRKRGIEITDTIRDAVAEQAMKEHNDAREIENEIAKHEEMKRRKLGQYAPSKARGGSGSTSATKGREAADTDKLKMWADVYQQDYTKLYNSEKQRILSGYANDMPLIMYEQLLKEGVDKNYALSLLHEFANNDGTYDIVALNRVFYRWAQGDLQGLPLSEAFVTPDYGYMQLTY
jgi:hypothetical protein